MFYNNPFRLPEEPCYSHYCLYEDADPQTTFETSIRLRQEGTRYGAAQEEHSAEETAISVGILTQWCRKELSVAHQITIQARQHHSRHSVVLQCATGYNLTSALEGQYSDGGEVGSRKSARHCER